MVGVLIGESFFPFQGRFSSSPMGFIIVATIKTRIFRVGVHVRSCARAYRRAPADDLFLTSIASLHRILYAPDDFFQPTSAPAPHLSIIRNVNQFSEHTHRPPDIHNEPGRRRNPCISIVQANSNLVVLPSETMIV